MFNYLAFIHGGLEQAGETATDDGRKVANQCLAKLRQIDNPEQFPPKLLFLLVSAAYLGGDDRLDESRARELIASIYKSFLAEGHRDVQLIGSSVAAVFFDSKIYPKGILLACLASKLLDVKVGVGTDVSLGAEEAVTSLCDGLNLNHACSDYLRPLPNRALLTFFPGVGIAGPTAQHSTDKLHALLLEKLTYTIPIVGGVSSADDPTRRRRGLQFVNHQPFTDALAACLIYTGLPLATSLAKGLETTGDIFHVKKLSPDGMRIEEFYEGLPGDIFGNMHDGFFKRDARPILLKDLAPGSDIVRAKCLPESKYRIVEVLREVRQHAAVEVATPTPQRMYDETKRAHELSLNRANITEPIGCFSFKCTGHLAYSGPLKLDLESGIRAIGKKFNIPSYIGGFFDGEAGTENGGSSSCRGWSVAAMILGDQISERTVEMAGFDSLIRHGAKLAGTFELDEDLEQSLSLIHDLGFPGAMISILMPDIEGEQFVPVKAKGSRFEKLLVNQRKGGKGDPLPYSVERSKKAQYLMTPSVNAGSEQTSDEYSVIPSQYVLPLFDPEGEIFAILRVDLGHARNRIAIDPPLARILEPIAAIVGAAINRIFAWEENRIARELDRTLKASLIKNNLNDALQQFLEGALKALSFKTGHVRVFNNDDNCLHLLAAVGGYSQEAAIHRASPDIGDWSPSIQAFKEGQAIIINDAQKHPYHQTLRSKYVDNLPMGEALDKVGSYANIPFQSTQGERRGTISVLSEQPWSFIGYHERVLAVLRRRMNQLVDDFLRKENEVKAQLQSQELGNQLKFLQSVSPKLHLLTDPVDFGSLEPLTEAFAAAMKAETASLFVWDNQHEQYVLRAAFGWQTDWVDAARYEKDSQWIGNLPVNRPLYVEDLYRYYINRKYPEPEGRYALQMFGHELSQNLSVEAWSIPLLVSGERLGALVTYLPTNPEWNRQSKRGGFAINNITLLQEGANHIAGLVKLLLSRQTDAFEKISQRRHKEIYAVLSATYDGVAFEKAVCQKVCDEFAAAQVDFYSVQNLNSPARLSRISSYKSSDRDSHVTRQEEEVAPEIIESAIRNRLTTFPFLPSITENPKLAAKYGLMKRVCIPLLTSGSVIGVLDIRWQGNQLGDDSLVGKRGRQRMAEIGQMIGSAYWRRRLTLQQKRVSDEAEHSRQAVQAVGAMVLQTAHRFSNFIQKIYRLSQRIAERDDEKWTEYLNRMSKSIEEAMNTIKWPMDTARRLQQLTPERSGLLELVARAVDEADSEYSGKIAFDIRDDMFVMIDPVSTKQALVNLINNAVRAISETNGGEVRITAFRIPGSQQIRLEIQDTGIGMTADEVDSALRGLAPKEERTGVGVLISKVLLQLQRGDLALESTKGIGTKAIITLPTA
jgi:signal transduction histidine kinase